MTDESVGAEDVELTPGEKAYRDAYSKEAAKHEITTVSRDEKDRRRQCTCGETGDATDIAGHWGPEADRAGLEAARATQQ